MAARHAAAISSSRPTSRPRASPRPTARRRRRPPDAGKDAVDAVQDALTPPPKSADGAACLRHCPYRPERHVGVRRPRRAEFGGDDHRRRQGDRHGAGRRERRVDVHHRREDRQPRRQAGAVQGAAGNGRRVSPSCTEGAGRQAARPHPTPPAKSAEAVTSNMIKNLEGMVAEARTAGEQAGRRRRHRPRRLPRQQCREPGTVKARDRTAASRPQSPQQPAYRDDAVPVPVTFIFNEANLTGEGPQGRRPAARIPEHQALPQDHAHRPCGRARHRRSQPGPFARSACRRSPASCAKAASTARLELVPKGKSEPYHGRRARRFQPGRSLPARPPRRAGGVALGPAPRRRRLLSLPRQHRTSRLRIVSCRVLAVDLLAGQVRDVEHVDRLLAEGGDVRRGDVERAGWRACWSARTAGPGGRGRRPRSP